MAEQKTPFFKSVWALLYLFASCAATLAIVDTIPEYIPGISTGLSLLISFVVAEIPFLGTVAGIFGAYVNWDLPVVVGIALFVWPIVILFVYLLRFRSPTTGSMTAGSESDETALAQRQPEASETGRPISPWMANVLKKQMEEAEDEENRGSEDEYIVEATTVSVDDDSDVETIEAESFVTGISVEEPDEASTPGIGADVKSKIAGDVAGRLHTSNRDDVIEVEVGPIDAVVDDDPDVFHGYPDGDDVQRTVTEDEAVEAVRIEDDPAAVPAEEAPVEEVPVEEVPVEGAPVEEVPVEEAPVEEAPVEEAPVEGAPVEEVPVEEAPVEEVPVEEVPVEEVPVEEVPAEEVPVEEVPVEEVPVEETPVEEVPAEEVPEEEVPAEEVPAEEVPAEEVPEEAATPFDVITNHSSMCRELLLERTNAGQIPPLVVSLTAELPVLFSVLGLIVVPEMTEDDLVSRVLVPAADEGVSLSELRTRLDERVPYYGADLKDTDGNTGNLFARKVGRIGDGMLIRIVNDSIADCRAALTAG